MLHAKKLLQQGWNGKRFFGSAEFPVAPETFIDRFQAAEGTTFNGEDKLFIGADEAWKVRAGVKGTKLYR